MTQALIRARIPYLPVHADHIERDAAQFSVLVLPNLGAMSDAQVASVRRFVAGGGGLVATGDSQPVQRMGRSATGLRVGRHVRRAHALTRDAPRTKPRRRKQRERHVPHLPASRPRTAAPG